MEKTINQRLKEYADHKNILGPEVYSNTKISRQLWSNFINTTTSIPSEKLGVVVKKMPDLNARWLLTGEGTMIEPRYHQHDNPYTANDQPQPPIPQRRCNDPGCNAELAKLNDEIVRYKMIIDQFIIKSDNQKADNQRKDDPPEKYGSGGVAKSGQKAQNKKAG